MNQHSKVVGVVFIVAGLVIAGPTIMFVGLRALAGINNIIVAHFRGGAGHTYSIHFMSSSGEPKPLTYLIVGGLVGAILIFSGIRQLNKKTPNKAL
jgi:hypothetical protein